MVALPFSVKAYSIECLIDEVARRSGASVNSITKRQHTSFFSNYFKKLDARSMVIEATDAEQGATCKWLNIYNPELRTQLHTQLNNPAIKTALEDDPIYQIIRCL